MIFVCFAKRADHLFFECSYTLEVLLEICSCFCISCLPSSLLFAHNVVSFLLQNTICVGTPYSLAVRCYTAFVCHIWGKMKQKILLQSYQVEARM